MTQDEIIEMARHIATTLASRMCDENGDTHGEELYAMGVDDIVEAIKLVAAKEREIYMQLFLDPENQPTQYGTVTAEFMNREIAKKQEDIIQIIKETPFSNWFQADVIEAIRARGEQA